MALLQIEEPVRGGLEAAENRITFGIDLGTTNSLVALFHEGEEILLTDITPSVVYFYKDGEACVGTPSNSNKSECVIVESIKRLIGKNEAQKVCVFDAEYTPEQVTSIILKDLAAKANESLSLRTDIVKNKTLVRDVVITVPAYFNDAERNATKFAAELADLNVVKLIAEPTAAGVCYDLENSAEGMYAVFDLGGGTFDVSVIKMKMGVLKVVAVGGKTTLGGDDFDGIIARNLGISKREARQIKENVGQDVRLSRDKFDEMVLPLLHECVRIFKKTLEDAGVSAEELLGIILVGGSTKMKIISEALKFEFPETKILNETKAINPDTAVAVGAAIHAENLVTHKGNLLLDVIPLSLGMETYGGICEKIIHRNSTIPIAKAQEFTTFEDWQDGIVIHVLQGERDLAKDCRSLVKFELKGIPRMKAGLPKIEVTFTVDENGILSVSAMEQTTKIKQSVEVKPSFGLTVADMKVMLEDSMRNAKTDIMRKILVETTIEAQGVLKSLDAAMASNSELFIQDENRDEILRIQNNLRNAMALEDRTLIQSLTQDLHNASQGFISAKIQKHLHETLENRRIEDFIG